MSSRLWLTRSCHRLSARARARQAARRGEGAGRARRTVSARLGLRLPHVAGQLLVLPPYVAQVVRALDHVLEVALRPGLRLERRAAQTAAAAQPARRRGEARRARRRLRRGPPVRPRRRRHPRRLAQVVDMAERSRAGARSGQAAPRVHEPARSAGGTLEGAGGQGGRGAGAGRAHLSPGERAVRACRCAPAARPPPVAPTDGSGCCAHAGAVAGGIQALGGPCSGRREPLRLAGAGSPLSAQLRRSMPLPPGASPVSGCAPGPGDRGVEPCLRLRPLSPAASRGAAAAPLSNSLRSSRSSPAAHVCVLLEGNRRRNVETKTVS